MKKTVSALLAAALLGFSAASCAKEEAPDLLTYRYDYDLSQYMELGNYKELPIQIEDTFSLEVTEQEVQQEIDIRVAYYARTKEVTGRAVEVDDIVRISYTLTDKNEGTLSAENFELPLGYGYFPEEVEALLIGKKAGDSVSGDGVITDLNFKFSDYSGETCHFDITVNAILVQEQPIFSEDFVRAYLGYDSIEDMKASIRKELEAEKKDGYYSQAVNIVWSEVLENTTVKQYPKKETDEIYNDMVSSNQAYAEMQGLNFTEYCKLKFQMTEDEFYVNVKKYAEAMVKEEMICYAIARAENLSISEEEYQELGAAYAKEFYDFDTLEELESYYDPALIRQGILFDMVKELTVDLASPTYVPAE